MNENVMTYKGYSARVEYDDDDRIFWGRLAGINDVVGFHGDSVKELRAAFEEAVDDDLDHCADVGKEPQKPYSGKMMFRVAPETHRRGDTRARHPLATHQARRLFGDRTARASGR